MSKLKTWLTQKTTVVFIASGLAVLLSCYDRSLDVTQTTDKIAGILFTLAQLYSASTFHEKEIEQ